MVNINIDAYKDLNKTDPFMIKETEFDSLRAMDMVFYDTDVDLTMFHHNISKQKNFHILNLNIESINFKELPFDQDFCDRVKNLTIHTNKDFNLCLDKFKNLEDFSMFSDGLVFWPYKFEDPFFKKIRNVHLKNISITVNLYEKLKSCVYFDYRYLSYQIFKDSYTKRGFTTYKTENEYSIEDGVSITPIDYEEFEDIIYKFLV